MYLRYLDEAGTHAAARHYKVAGVAVYGRLILPIWALAGYREW